MVSSNNLDALSQDGELPFGHPGRRSDDTSEGFDRRTLMDQGPEPDYTPDEDGGVVHYAPGDRPLCGNDSMTRVYTDDPRQMAGCGDCLELVAEDLQDHTVPRPLPSLPAGDHRPGRSGVASGGLEAMPALRSEGVVKMGEGWMRY